MSDSLKPGAPICPVPELSIVVPVRNEAANIEPLVREICAALAGTPFEIVYIDDGSADDTPLRLAQVQAQVVQVSGTDLVWRRHRTSCGQSAAVLTGIRLARGAWIATLDGDGQNDPSDIPALFARARQEAEQGRSPVLIAGHRTDRRDSWVKRGTSRAANAIRASLLGDATPDTGCGLKVFRREAFLELPHFDHMHRFLPALFIRAGGRVVSVSVHHRPRTRGRSNYGTLDRLWAGIFDLIGVYWLQRRWRRPEIEESSAPVSLS